MTDLDLRELERAAQAAPQDEWTRFRWRDAAARAGAPLEPDLGDVVRVEEIAESSFHAWSSRPWLGEVVTLEWPSDQKGLPEFMLRPLCRSDLKRRERADGRIGLRVTRRDRVTVVHPVEPDDPPARKDGDA